MPNSGSLTADISALELFNEKAEKLRALGFVRSLETDNSGFQVTFHPEGGVSASRYGPDNEAVEAFVLTFRVFVQNNEPSSIRNTVNRYRRLHQESLIPTVLLNNFEDARNKLLNYLASNTPLVIGGQDINVETRAIIYQEVFDVFMWGGLAHANRQQKERFDDWSKGSMRHFFPMLEDFFIEVLREYLRVIWYMRGQNKKVLTELASR